MRVDGDSEHLAADTAVEPLGQAIGLRRARPGVAILRAKGSTGFGEGRGEATAVVGQHVGEAEGEGCCGLTQEGDGAPLGFVVLDGEVDRAGPAVDGD